MDDERDAEVGRARSSRRRWQVMALVLLAWASVITILFIAAAADSVQAERDRDAWAVRALAAEAALAGKPIPAPVTPEQPKVYGL